MVLLSPGTYVTLEYCGFVLTWHICHSGGVIVFLSPCTFAGVEGLWYLCHKTHMPHREGRPQSEKDRQFSGGRRDT